MSIVEFKGGRLTHRYLMNRAKYDLADRVMTMLSHIEKLRDFLLASHVKDCTCEGCRIARGYLDE